MILTSPFARAAKGPDLPFPIWSERLSIRPFCENDLPEIAKLLCDLNKKIQPSDYLIDEARQLLFQINDRDQRNITMGLFVRDKMLVGRLSASAQGGNVQEGSEWEIGYRAIGDHRKRGYITEAVDAIKPVFRDIVKARALTASVHKRNADSLSVVRRTKFVEYQSANAGHRFFKFNF